MELSEMLVSDKYSHTYTKLVHKAVNNANEFNGLADKRLKLKTLKAVMRIMDVFSYDWYVREAITTSSPLYIFNIDDIVEKLTPTEVGGFNSHIYLVERTPKALEVIGKKYNLYRISNPQIKKESLEDWIEYGISNALEIHYGIKLMEISLRPMGAVAAIVFSEGLSVENARVLAESDNPIAKALITTPEAQRKAFGGYKQGTVFVSSPSMLNSYIRTMAEDIKRGYVEGYEYMDDIITSCLELGIVASIEKCRGYVDIEMDFSNCILPRPIEWKVVEKYRRTLWGRLLERYSYNGKGSNNNIMTIRKSVNVCQIKEFLTQTRDLKKLL